MSTGLRLFLLKITWSELQVGGADRTQTSSTLSPSQDSGSDISVESCDSECVSLSSDEGEANWDAIGRMSSVRRSSHFNKPRLINVTLKSGPQGYGLQLEGRSPPTIASVAGNAEGHGICVGDKLLEVNGCSVRGCTHQQAGALFNDSPNRRVSILVHSFKPTPKPSGLIVNSGWLMMKGTSRFPLGTWQRRWLVLKDDCIAYYYPNCEKEAELLGAIVLRQYTVSKAGRDVKRENAFKLTKGGAKSYMFASETHEDMERWAKLFTEAATLKQREVVCFSEGSAHNIALSALSIKEPDCSGFLYKQGQHFKTWKKRYCILKCHQLFYYAEMSETTAYGVMDLTRYYVDCGVQKSGKHYFTAIPPVDGLRTFYFYAESDRERARWIEAMRKNCSRQISK